LGVHFLLWQGLGRDVKRISKSADFMPADMSYD
jgi:hypothetical protein